MKSLQSLIDEYDDLESQLNEIKPVQKELKDQIKKHFVKKNVDSFDVVAKSGTKYRLRTKHSEYDKIDWSKVTDKVRRMLDKLKSISRVISNSFEIRPIKAENTKSKKVA